MKRILLISEPIPPMVSSVAVILGRIFRLFPADSVVILTAKQNHSQYGVFIDENHLACKHFVADLPNILSTRKHNKCFVIFYDFLRIPLVVWKGLRIVRQEKINSIISTTYGSFEIAAYLISKLTKKPLYIYLLDLYVDIEINIFRKVVRCFFARYLFKSASNIFVMSEPLSKHLKEKYNVPSIVIPHSVELSKYNIAMPRILSSDKKIIVYTGMIYDAHRDCILDMVEAIKNLSNIEFHIYTPRNVDCLKSEGIYGHNIRVCMTPHNSIPSIQKGAGILFLPMSFNSPYPKVINTASPGKMVEYLAAAKPILVYAPPYSYVTQYARQHGFGMVVDKKSPAILKEAIMNLLEKKDIRDKLIFASKQTVSLHRSDIIAKKLMHLMNI